MKRFGILIMFLLGLVISGLATHNRAGEITYTKLIPDDPNDFRYEITITTCTKADAPADRPYLNIRYGDEAINAPLDSIQRVEVVPSLEIIPPDNARLNYYRAIHTYPGTGTYIISMEDPNRNGGVINMDESISQVFYLESMLVISPVSGHNNSVKLLYPAKDEACINSVWEHNPGAYDIDGDSIVYSLVPCKGLGGNEIPSWELPSLIEASEGIDDVFSINTITGTITWDAPAVAGEYNIAIRIEEYRNGQLMGYVTRDMQIKVLNCANTPPQVAIVRDTCIIAGETLSFNALASDPDGNGVFIDAVGAPLTEVENTASFVVQSDDTSFGTFTWTAGCEEIRPATYQVLFVAEDNSSSTDLVDIMEMNITVISPPVENVSAEPNGLAFDVSWDPSPCEEVIGYKIYKRAGFFDFNPSHCETGVPVSTGYELLTTVDASVSDYLDEEEVDFGVDRCYIVTSCFASGSESIASEPSCAAIDLIIPVMTKVSVGVTDLTAGVDTVQWAPPFSEDTLLLTPPFKYRLYHGEGFNEAQDLIFETEQSPFILGLTTEFTHSEINTLTTPNAYRVELVDSEENIISSRVSTSQFLTITPDDNQLELTWTANTSWIDSSYEIYKLNSVTSLYELIGTSTEPSFLDSGLLNNVEYCYYILALGAFSNNAPEVLPETTINFSQIVCSVPVDLTAPCAPELTGEISCEDGTVNLTWVNPTENCSDDIVGYNIYFKPFTDSEYEVINSIDDSSTSSYVYENQNNITGCFYITAVDSLLPGLGGVLNQNESLASLEICSESCPVYEIPNVFSPQGDNFNDLFQPFPFQYVDSIDLVIFNRWGTPVFKTTDPAIGWDGTNIDSGEISSDGVYFYTLSVFTSKLTGVIEEKSSGNITLLDGQKQPTN